MDKEKIKQEAMKYGKIAATAVAMYGAQNEAYKMS